MSQSYNSLALVSVPSYKDSHKESNMIKAEEVQVKLEKEYATNPVFKAVADVLKLRERNRHNLTTRGLYYKMRKAGYNYQEKELVPIFTMLSEMGVAKAQANNKGKVESLRHFQMPLQAIGAVASGQKPTRIRVAKIEAAPLVVKPKAVEKAPANTLTVHFNRKPIQLTIPAEITKEELLVILTKFQ